jgi:hypothetical protein
MTLETAVVLLVYIANRVTISFPLVRNEADCI